MSDFEDFLRMYLKEKKPIKEIKLDLAFDTFYKFNKQFKRKGTLDFYHWHLKPFEDFCSLHNINYFNDITNDFISLYIDFLKSKMNANTTINKRLCCLRCLYKYLLENGFINDLKLNFRHLEEKNKEISCINEIELNKLLEYVKKRDLKSQLIIYLLVSTGVRRNELVHIKVKNIDFEQKRIFLDFTKNKKSRYLYLNDFVSDKLKNYVSYDRVYLFEDKNKNMISPMRITYLLWYYKKKLNIENLSPHKLRHTYGTLLLKNGANLEEVRRLLGHSDFKMTKRYIDYIDNDLKSANEKYNPLKNERSADN